MKKILLIWVGVIVVLIVGGIVYGQLTKSNEPEGPEKTEIVYKDDNGNDVKEEVEKDQVNVTIAGQDYSYNAGVWKGKPIKIADITLEGPLYIDNILDAGFEEHKNSSFKLDDKHSVYIHYNTYYGHLFSLSAYVEPYNTVASTSLNYCEDIVLPANIKLGESTKEYVESIYGVSHGYESQRGDLVTVHYYGDSKKRGERLQLMYQRSTGILIGFEWSFDVT